MKRLSRLHVIAQYQRKARASTSRVDKVLSREDESHASASRNMATAFLNGTRHKCITRSMAPPPPLLARVS
ncbi:hypothetical protein X963_2031 [Burkholderia pseudomallei MSHR7498]|nr:hypothetical protein X963_2031 [Burkholderia pseudomallei MSHR7498]